MRELIFMGRLTTGQRPGQSAENGLEVGTISPQRTVKRCKTGMTKNTTLRKTGTFLGLFKTSLLSLLSGKVHTEIRPRDLNCEMRLAAACLPLQNHC